MFSLDHFVITMSWTRTGVFLNLGFSGHNLYESARPWTFLDT
jgi:hypothetical protein